MELTAEMIRTLKPLIEDLNCGVCNASSQCHTGCLMEEWLKEEEAKLANK